MISSGSHSFQMLKESKECVINLPTADMIQTVIDIGTCSGSDTNKFTKFGLTQVESEKVKAPSIKECYANFECKLHDDVLAGVFMHSGKNVFHSQRLRER